MLFWAQDTERRPTNEKKTQHSKLKKNEQQGPNRKSGVSLCAHEGGGVVLVCYKTVAVLLTVQSGKIFSAIEK